MEFTTAELIRRHRIALKLTQKEVGQAMGVSGPAVSKWERGSLLKGNTLKKLAKVLKCDVNDLIPQSKRTTPSKESTAPSQLDEESDEIILMVRELLDLGDDEAKKKIYGEVMFQYKRLKSGKDDVTAKQVSLEKGEGSKSRKVS